MVGARQEGSKAKCGPWTTEARQLAHLNQGRHHDPDAGHLPQRLHGMHLPHVGMPCSSGRQAHRHCAAGNPSQAGRASAADQNDNVRRDFRVPSIRSDGWYSAPASRRALARASTASGPAAESRPLQAQASLALAMNAQATSSRPPVAEKPPCDRRVARAAGGHAKVLLDRQPQHAAQPGQLRKAHAAQLRKAHAEVAQGERDVGILEVDLAEQPGGARIGREQLDHGQRIEIRLRPRGQAGGPQLVDLRVGEDGTDGRSHGVPLNG